MFYKNPDNFQENLKKALSSTGEVCSIRIVSEDDGSYDVCAWDERGSVRWDDLEIGRISTYEKALQKMKNLVKENPNIIFLRMHDLNC